jgi:non-canonical purine NTP pyrophosphatase (RdgB/HAM1 family)
MAGNSDHSPHLRRGLVVQANELRTILDQTGATYSSDGDGPSTASLVQLRVVTVDLPEIQEVDTEAVAKDKALIASQLAGGPAVVEDTALHFHALGGMPGPFIKWFQDSLGNDGLYKILAAYPDKAATAVCTLAFCPAPHADPVLFTGECKGAIVAPVPGAGFGYVCGSTAMRAVALSLAFLTAPFLVLYISLVTVGTRFLSPLGSIGLSPT